MRMICSIAIALVACGSSAGPTPPSGTPDGGKADPDAKTGTHTPDAALPNPDGLTCTSTSACWDNCVQNNIPVSTCKSNCGLGDGVSCWQLCTGQGVTVSTCKSYCNADPGCEASLCWENCGANDVQFPTCLSYCGKDHTACAACSPSRSAFDQCWALGTAQGAPSSTVGSYCN